MGNDVTVGYAASQGILELNTYLPVIADALLESATLLGNVAACSPSGASPASRSTRTAPAATPSAPRRWPRRSTRSSATSGRRRSSRQAQASGRSIIDVVVAEGVLPRRRGPPGPRPATRRRPRSSDPRPRSRSAAPCGAQSLASRSGAAVQEVGEQFVAAAGEDALGVELHALDGVVAVAHAHHRAVVGGRRDGELGGDRVGRQRQRVVAGRRSAATASRRTRRCRRG